MVMVIRRARPRVLKVVLGLAPIAIQPNLLLLLRLRLRLALSLSLLVIRLLKLLLCCIGLAVGSVVGLTALRHDCPVITRASRRRHCISTCVRVMVRLGVNDSLLCRLGRLSAPDLTRAARLVIP